MKRLSIILVVLVISASMFSFTAFASSSGGDYERVITLSASQLQNLGTLTFWSVDDKNEPYYNTKNTINRFYPLGSGLNSSNAYSFLLENLPLGTNENGLSTTATEVNYDFDLRFQDMIDYISVSAYFGSNTDVTYSDGGYGTYFDLLAVYNEPVGSARVTEWANSDEITITSTLGTFSLNGTSIYNRRNSTLGVDSGNYVNSFNFRLVGQYANPYVPSNRYTYFCLNSIKLYVQSNRYADIVQALQDIGLKIDEVNDNIVDGTNRVVGTITSEFKKLDDTLTNPTPSQSESIQSQQSVISEQEEIFSDYESMAEQVTLSPEQSDVLASLNGNIQSAGDDIKNAFDNPVGTPFALFGLIFESGDFNVGGLSWQVWGILLVFAFALISILLYGRSDS